MISYRYPSIFFTKTWCWFADPREVPDADIVNVFSYMAVDSDGYKRKEALTTVIDLSCDEATLWENMRKRYVREQIGKGERNGISITIGDDWRNLVPVYREFRKGKGIHEDNPKVFAHTLVVTAAYDGKIIAGGAFVHDEKYMRALALASVRFTDDGKVREIIGQANRMVIWSAIKNAKQMGLQAFDLGGISPDSNDQGERGLSEFKEAFGGERKMGYYYTKLNSPVLRGLRRIRALVKI